MRLFFLLFIATNWCIAQPILTQSSFGAEVNFLGHMAYFPTNLPVPPNPEGANVVWNFSTLQVWGEPATISSVPLLSIYTVDNLNLSTFSDYAEYQQSGFGNNYFLYKIEESSYRLVGNVSSSGIFSGGNQLIYPLPFNFLDQHENFIYDSYGTLITPYDTYTDVIRLKKYTPPTMSTAPHTIYKYYSTNPFRDLLTIEHFDSTSVFLAEYLDLSAHESSALKFTLYPNPAETHLAVFTTVDDNNLSAKIFNVHGQQMKSLNLNNSNSQIDVQSF